MCVVEELVWVVDDDLGCVFEVLSATCAFQYLVGRVVVVVVVVEW